MEFGLQTNAFGGSIDKAINAQGVFVGGVGWNGWVPGRAIVGGAYVRYNS